MYVRSKMSWAEDHFSDCIAIVIAFKEWKNAKISGRFDIGGKVSVNRDKVMCVCACVCACMHARVYVCVCVRACLSVCLCVCMYMCACVYAGYHQIIVLF